MAQGLRSHIWQTCMDQIAFASIHSNAFEWEMAVIQVEVSAVLRHDGELRHEVQLLKVFERA